MSKPIFIYGTLKKGYPNPISTSIYKYLSFYNTGWVFGSLYKIRNYPGLVLNKKGDKIFGEIYLLTDPEKVIKIIDPYEEVGPEFNQPNEYKKALIDVYTSEGQIKCLVYLYNWTVKGLEKINSGKY